MYVRVELLVGKLQVMCTGSSSGDESHAYALAVRFMGRAASDNANLYVTVCNLAEDPQRGGTGMFLDAGSSSRC